MPPARKNNILLRMHPLHRIALSLIISLVLYIIIRGKYSGLITSMFLWDTFSFFYLLLSWFVLTRRSVPEIRRLAKKDDGSTVFVFLSIVVSSFAGMLAVLFLLLAHNNTVDGSNTYLPLSIAGMLFSWLMVHSIYAFHYAHMYYDDDKAEPGKDAFGLEFPEKNPKPNYIDFAYFSFVIGCTFQVSDIEISSPKIRRVVLFHTMLAFALNTFVVALTINIIAGLSK